MIDSMIHSRKRMRSRRRRAWCAPLVVLLLVLAALLALAGCGAQTTATNPTSAHITLNRPGAAQQAWTVTDSAKVQQLYDHILALTPIPPSVDRACQPLDSTYQFDFLSGDTQLLHGAITQCRGYIQLSDKTTRGLDEKFWSLVNAAVGQNITPQSPSGR